MRVQIIERNGNPEWVVIPYRDYLRLVAEVEMLQDVRDYDAILEAVEQDYEAVMETQAHFHALGYSWPRAGFTIAENLADLKQH